MKQKNKKKMKKRLLSMVLCLSMMLTLFPPVVHAAGMTTVEMGNTELTTGVYVPAVDSTTPQETPANYRVVDKADDIPTDGNYLEYNAEEGTLTVHGKVDLISDGQSVLSVTSGALTVTGETGASLTMIGNQNPTVSVRSTTLTLSGSVDFTATAMRQLAVFGGMTTAEDYSGNITLTAPASAPVLSGECSLITTGDLTLKHSACSGTETVLLSGSGAVALSGANVTLTTVDTNTSPLFGAGDSFTFTATTGNVTLLNKGSSKFCTQNMEITATASNGTVTKVLSSGTEIIKDGVTYSDITETGLDLRTLPEVATTYKAGSGTVTFTPANGSNPATFTLNNATLEKNEPDDGSGSLFVSVDNPFIIDVIGENTLPVMSFMQKPTITGNGTLNTKMTVISQTSDVINASITVYGMTELVASEDLYIGREAMSEDITYEESLTVPTGTVLTIPSSAKLIVLDLAYLNNQGTIVNNGVVSLLVDKNNTDGQIEKAVKSMKLDSAGTGLVEIYKKVENEGDDDVYLATYTNSGVKMNEPDSGDSNVNDNDELVLVDDNGDAVATTSGNGYNWDATSKTLTLTNLYFNDFGDSIILPSEATIVTNGKSMINSISMNDKSENKKLTFSGTAPLTVTRCIGTSQVTELTVDEGAQVSALDGISIGSSGNVEGLLTVNGKLTATACYDSDIAILCGKVDIGSAGVLTVSKAEVGVRVNGMNSDGNGMVYDGAFTMADGSKFTASCTDCNVMVYAGTTELTEETAQNAIVLPENYLPEGYEIRVVSGDNGGQTQYAATIAKTDATLTLESERVFGAGGNLTMTFIILPPTRKTELAYTGLPQELINAGATHAGTMQYSLSETTGFTEKIPTATNAGDYIVYYKIVGAANHTEDVASVLVNIAKAASTLTAPAGKTGLAYTGSSQELINEGSTHDGTMQYSLSETTGFSTSIPTATKVGSYTVYYKVAGDANHKDSEVNAVTPSIEKATTSVNVTTKVSGDSGNRTVVVTAEIVKPTAGATATGKVNFYDVTGTKTQLGSAIVLVDGKAMYTWTGLADGDISVQAEYAGDANYKASTSQTVSVDTRKKNQSTLEETAIGIKTGDRAPIALLFIIVIISGCGILYFNKKRKQVK